MPEVRVRYNKAVVDSDTIVRMRSLLPTIVAERLACEDPGGGLMPNKVVVSFEQYGSFDRHSESIEVIIDALEFPKRLENIDERNRKISEEMRKIMISRGISYCVWTRLHKGAFMDGKGQWEETKES